SRFAEPSREPLSTTRIWCSSPSAVSDWRSCSARLYETITTEIFVAGMLSGSKGHLAKYNSPPRAGGGGEISGLPFPRSVGEDSKGDCFSRIGIDSEFRS